MPARVFVSYSHRDEATATALGGHLEQLETLGLAELWFDRHLELGEAWESRIFEEIRRADVVLLLVSPAFLASTFINERELPLVREVGETGASVIPIVVAPCLWEQHPYIGSLQAFGQGRPVESPTTRTFARQAAELVRQLSALLQSPAHREALTAGAAVEASAALPGGGEMLTEEAQTGARVDASGAAYKGSQLQTQIYANARTEELDAAVRDALPTLPADAHFEWRSPLAAERYREYRDGAFLRALELDRLRAELREFWPTGGPRWDALATVTIPRSAQPGVLLVEGKSYPGEMEGGGAKGQPSSNELISASLRQTQEALALAPDPRRWMGRYYQFANRLAHLLWLRRMGVEASLVHLLFTDDPHGPTGETEWRRAIEQMHAELGLDQTRLEHVGAAGLPALAASALTEER